jgi:DNA invertase Pin-like site-specific DNA recombinase
MFGVVVVWRFDRFARSVKQLVMALEEFRTLGIEFISHQEALDTSTSMGKPCSPSLLPWPRWKDP